MKIPYTITSEAITLFHKGKMFTFPTTFRKFNELKEHLRENEHDVVFIESLVNIRSTIERISKGNIKIYGDEVYYKNVRVRNSLAERLVNLLDDNFDITPWMNFMENVMLNPSADSRERLFTFLEKNKSPLTEDGHFLGFKRVRHDFLDHYTGKMDNSPGQIVQMPREKVDSNNSVTCSHGLHISASIYLTESGYADSNGAKILVCKVNPRDVVAVPPDYNETKMRVCRYEVLSEAEIGEIKEIEQQELYVEEKPEVVVIEDTVENSDGVKETIRYIVDQFADYYVFSDLSIDIIGDTVFVGFVDSFEYFKDVDATYQFVDHFQSEMFKLSDEIFKVSDELQEIQFSLGFTDKKYNDILIDLESLSVDEIGYGNIKGSVKNTWYNITDLIEFIEDYVEDNSDNDESELLFERNGEIFTQSQILKGVADFGSITKWANSVGVPRSTAQGWVKKITN